MITRTYEDLRELVVCGETEMTASRLRSFMDSVRDPGDTSGITYIRKGASPAAPD